MQAAKIINTFFNTNFHFMRFLLDIRFTVKPKNVKMEKIEKKTFSNKFVSWLIKMDREVFIEC